MNAVYDIYYRMLTQISILGYIIVEPALTGTILYSGGSDNEHHTQLSIQKELFVSIYFDDFRGKNAVAQRRQQGPK